MRVRNPYDEGRRGWLCPADDPQGEQGRDFTSRGRRIFKTNDWNHIRVEAISDSISTWLNGIPCADLRDAMTLRGFIALQVHSIWYDTSKEGAQIRWRNLRI